MATVTGKIAFSDALLETLFTPYQEGVARIRRGYTGVNEHDVALSKLDIVERVKAFAAGFFLMLPLINVLLWAGMRTLGHSDSLSHVQTGGGAPAAAPAQAASAAVAPPAGGAAPAEAPAVPSGAPPAAAAAPRWYEPDASPLAARGLIPMPVPEGAPLRVETSRMRDTIKGVVSEAEWRSEQFARTYVVTRRSPKDFSYFVFNADRTEQQYFYYESDSKVMTFEKSGEQLRTKGSQGDDSTPRALEKRIPWIQAPPGFKHFICSAARELRFYSLDPRGYELRETCLTKKEEGNLPSLGPAIRVEMSMGPGATFRQQLEHAAINTVGRLHLWFNPQDGRLLQYDAYLPALIDTQSILLPPG